MESFINNLLANMLGVAKPQKKFLVTLFVTILLMRGKVNFRNLSRYSDLAEKTYARQFSHAFDFATFNEQLMAEIVPAQHEKIGRWIVLIWPKVVAKHMDWVFSMTAVTSSRPKGWKYRIWR